MPSFAQSRRIRWAAPVVVMGLIGLIAAVPTISAGADPKLPALSATQLVAMAQAAKTSKLTGLSGTIQLNSNLGLPSLSQFSGSAGVDGGFNPTDLLSGVHSADVWVSKDGFKATYSDSTTSEDDVITNGKDLWTWQSRGSQVTHIVLPADSATAKPEATKPDVASPVKTPDQVAQDLLDKLSPSTVVSVSTPVYVANHRAAYQLILTPKPPSASTVGQITLAIDKATGLPIRIQIFAAGQGKPALTFGFTRLNIGAQSAKTFTFTAPPGAKVTNKVMSSGDYGSLLPAESTIPAHERRHGRTASGAVVTAPAIPSAPTGSGTGKAPTVVGSGWATVYVFGPGQLPGQIAGPLSEVAVKQPNGERLLSTALINVLVLNNGDVAVGAVNLGALQAAAASAG